MISGGNTVTRRKELQVLEFVAGGNSYGMDIQDIKEILPYRKPLEVPNAHPVIEGFDAPRDFLITVIDLAKCLLNKDTKITGANKIILTILNDYNIAFHVEQVTGIHKVMESDIMEPDTDSNVSTEMREAVAGILDLGNRQIEMLDVKAIFRSINPSLEI